MSIDFNRYYWLNDNLSSAPKTVQECVSLGRLNTTEIPGPKSNPEILKLAAEAGVSNIYKNDDVAWCAVAATVVCLRAGKTVGFTGYYRLRARSFLQFGKPVTEPMFGDVIVFGRDGGGHVGFYIGEDNAYFHVAGGNQSNQFNIIRIAKNRAIGYRRPFYKIQPASVRKVFLKADGEVSVNEK